MAIRREQAMYKLSKKPSSHSRTAHRCAIRLVVPLCFAMLGPVAAQAGSVTSTCTAGTNGVNGPPATAGGAGGDGTVTTAPAGNTDSSNTATATGCNGGT